MAHKRRSEIQSLIDLLRGKKPTLKKMMVNNVIIFPQKLKKSVSFNINGENNRIEIDENVNVSDHLRVSIYGDNNFIKIESGARISSSRISMGQKHPNFGKVTNSVFVFGECSSVESLSYVTFNSNSKCIIGKNCMFSFDISIYNTDAHPIYDVNTNEIVNKVKEINIGNHCWIGAHTTILKNTQIADDCIVGWSSVVAGKHLTPHCAIAGNPARKVREGITWSPNGSNGYVQNIL